MKKKKTSFICVQLSSKVPEPPPFQQSSKLNGTRDEMALSQLFVTAAVHIFTHKKNKTAHLKTRPPGSLGNNLAKASPELLTAY